MGLPRGIRTNNPGNIVYSGRNHWLGEVRASKDDKYAAFCTPYFGIRALMKTLVNYKKLHGLNTVRTIVYKWAPPSENNTKRYVLDVARQMRVKIDAKIDAKNKKTLIKLTKAIINHENGRGPFNVPHGWYSEEVFNRAADEVLKETK